MAPELIFAMQALQLLWLVGLTIIGFVRRPGEQAARAAQAAATAADALRGRVDVLEERLRHMPSSEELTELDGTVRSIQVSIDGIRASQVSVAAAVTRIENYLLHAK